jgi:hypothetical protein
MPGVGRLTASGSGAGEAALELGDGGKIGLTSSDVHWFSRGYHRNAFLGVMPRRSRGMTGM